MPSWPTPAPTSGPSRSTSCSTPTRSPTAGPCGTAISCRTCRPPTPSGSITSAATPTISGSRSPSARVSAYDAMVREDLAGEGDSFTAGDRQLRRAPAAAQRPAAGHLRQPGRALGREVPRHPHALHLLPQRPRPSRARQHLSARQDPRRLLEDGGVLLPHQRPRPALYRSRQPERRTSSATTSARSPTAPIASTRTTATRRRARRPPASRTPSRRRSSSPASSPGRASRTAPPTVACSPPTGSSHAPP